MQSLSVSVRVPGEHRGRTRYYFASVTKEEKEARGGERMGRECERGREEGEGGSTAGWDWLARQAWIFTYTHVTSRIY